MPHTGCSFPHYGPQLPSSLPAGPEVALEVACAGSTGLETAVKRLAAWVQYNSHSRQRAMRHCMWLSKRLGVAPRQNPCMHVPLSILFLFSHGMPWLLPTLQPPTFLSAPTMKLLVSKWVIQESEKLARRKKSENCKRQGWLWGARLWSTFRDFIVQFCPDQIGKHYIIIIIHASQYRKRTLVCS